MRTAIILAAAMLTLAGSASAQLLPNAPGKFCLRGQSGDSKGIENCQFQTMAQCEAAKAGQKDQCVPNGSLKSTSSTTGSGSKN